MAELATVPREKMPFTTVEKDVARLDQIASDLKSQVEIGKVFIIPGATACGAALDLARTIVRRGERHVAEMVTPVR